MALDSADFRKNTMVDVRASMRAVKQACIRSRRAGWVGEKAV